MITTCTFVPNYCATGTPKQMWVHGVWQSLRLKHNFNSDFPQFEAYSNYLYSKGFTPVKASDLIMKTLNRK
jgi:hypothetical protein